MPLLEGVHEGWHRLDTPTKNACCSLVMQTLLLLLEGVLEGLSRYCAQHTPNLHATAGPQCCGSRVSVKGALIAVLLSTTAAPGCTTE